MKPWRLLPVAVLFIACASGGPVRPPATTPAPTPAAPTPTPAPASTPASLTALLEGYVAAARSGGSAAGLPGVALSDPPAFFTRAFGAEPGARLAAAYASMAPSLSAEGLVRELSPPVRERGLSVVHVDPVVRSAAHPERWTNRIVEALVEPVELFRVRLLPAGATDPNTPGFFDLGFFALEDGQWRSVGDLRAIRP